MISSILKKASLCMIFFVFSAVHSFANDLVNGKMIKEQAKTFFDSNGLSLSLVISDKRTFFPCSSSLEFSQRTKNNWDTILVKCSSENWSTLVRSKLSSIRANSNNKTPILAPLKIVVVAKNISKGQILSYDDLILIDRPEVKFHGAFEEIKEVIGRRAKVSLASGTVIKARHLDTVYLVNREDTVLIIAKNTKLSITTSATALEDGQLGDMINVENINSKKVLKAIITGRKKVSPITNM